jgi:hypothetical protein
MSVKLVPNSVRAHFGSAKLFYSFDLPSTSKYGKCHGRWYLFASLQKGIKRTRDDLEKKCGGFKTLMEPLLVPCRAFSAPTTMMAAPHDSYDEPSDQ